MSKYIDLLSKPNYCKKYSQKEQDIQMEELINEHLELYRERPRNSVKDFRSSLDERLQKFFDQREEDLEFECLENIEKY